MSEEQLKAFLEKVKSDTELKENSNQQPMLKLLLKSLKKLDFQLPQKIFKQCNRQSEVSEEELTVIAGALQEHAFANIELTVRMPY